MVHSDTRSNGDAVHVRVSRNPEGLRTCTVQTITLSMEQQNVRIDHLAHSIEKQNSIILGMQKEFQVTMGSFSSRLQELYSMNTSTTQVTPTTTTTVPRH